MLPSPEARGPGPGLGQCVWGAVLENRLLRLQVPWEEEGAAAAWLGPRERRVPTTSLAGARSECGACARPRAGPAMPDWGRGARLGRGGCELPSSPP